MAIPVFTKKTIDSTNELAKRILKKKPDLLSDGFVVIADTQTKGKGTQGRTWHSESTGGLYYSLAIKPLAFDFEAVEYYHHSIAEGIQTVVKSLTNITLAIRFPNDLFLAEKKVGGVLMESAMKATKNPTLDYLIIGIGLNINQESFPTDLKDIATSFHLETHQTFNKKKLIKPLTHELKAIFFSTT